MKILKIFSELTNTTQAAESYLSLIELDSGCLSTTLQIFDGKGKKLERAVADASAVCFEDEAMDGVDIPCARNKGLFILERWRRWAHTLRIFHGRPESNPEQVVLVMFQNLNSEGQVFPMGILVAAVKKAMASAFQVALANQKATASFIEVAKLLDYGPKADKSNALPNIDKIKIFEAAARHMVDTHTRDLKTAEEEHRLKALSAGDVSGAEMNSELSLMIMVRPSHCDIAEVQK